jgi:8-oxo-dGTP pyrophosphatase MutT (NUDIX family)
MLPSIRILLVWFGGEIDIDPLVSIKRELLEETGIVAQT